MHTVSVALSVKYLSVFYEHYCAIADVSIDIARGTLVAIVGPNGGGKTTFIKAIVGLITPHTGTVHFFGEPFAVQRKRVAYIPQRFSVDWDFPASVLDIVLMGRYVHIGWLSRPSADDTAKSFEALRAVGMERYAQCHIRQLSGGQQQRVFVARALVQEADILLLDEPLGGIDIKTEKIIFELLQQLRTEGKTVIVVHHDVHTLSTYFDAVFLLNKKKIAYGPAREIAVSDYMYGTYGNHSLIVPRTYT